MAEGVSRGKIRVALDAMGGDFAPQETVKGALMAARAHPENLEVLLVGHVERLEHELGQSGYSRGCIRVVPAPEVIPDGGHAALAMHARPSSSVAIATQLVRDCEADGVVAVGHTGACLIAANWYLGRMPGIDRPAAGVSFPFAPQTFAIDLGLNPDAKPKQYLQFALLGSAYSRALLGVANPTVAILSNGAEEGKGNKVTQAAYNLLKRSKLNFIGNVEGLDVPAGKANVVVCDGFVGNVMLKTMEGLSAMLLRRFDELAGADGHAALARFREELSAMTDITTTNQAILLLGVNGLFVPGHGRAKAPAIKHAIETTMFAVERNLLARLREAIEAAYDELAATDVERVLS